MNPRVLSAFGPLALLAGCGSDEPVEPAAPEGPKLVIPPPSDPTPSEAKLPGKGLGLSKDQIMKGLDEIKLEDADLPSPEGDTFIGHTADFKVDATPAAGEAQQYSSHAANMVMY